MSFGEKGLDKNFCIKSKLKISISYISSMSCIFPIFHLCHVYVFVHYSSLSLYLSINLSMGLIICVSSAIFIYFSLSVFQPNLVVVREPGAGESRIQV